MNLGCRKRYQMSAVAMYYHSEILYKNKRICNFIFINEIFKNKTRKNGKIKWVNVRSGLYLGNPKP